MQKSFGIIKITDSDYPKLLKQIYKPPKTLYFKGKIQNLEKTCISIVGTRKYTDYGKEFTEKIIKELSVLDITIVSGLALGIDTIAHESALKNNLPTIAVLGSGLNKIYPPKNKKLSERIIENGLLISEYPSDTEPKSFHFPQRNRIISGLSIATIVMEAPKKSGALITAEFALEQGRDIFALPADVDRETSEGILKLLQRGGAYPASCGNDIIELLKKQPYLLKKSNRTKYSPLKKPQKEKLKYNLSSQQNIIFKSLTPRRRKSFEQIQSKTKIPTQTLLTELSFMEIQGLISNIDGKYFRKC